MPWKPNTCNSCQYQGVYKCLFYDKVKYTNDSDQKIWLEEKNKSREKYLKFKLFFNLRVFQKTTLE